LNAFVLGSVGGAKVFEGASDKQVMDTKAFKWLSIKSRVKGFLRVGIDVILDWFF
jgi:hypothetical protein